MKIDYRCSCGHTGLAQPLVGAMQDRPGWVSPLIWEFAELEARCEGCGVVLRQREGAFSVLDHEMPLAVGFVVVRQSGLDASHWVLAVSRRDDHTAFGFPGGKVDPSDGSLAPTSWVGTIQRAMARELREEVGIDVDPRDLVILYQGVCPGGADGVAYWMVSLALPGGLHEEPRTQPDEGVVKWVAWKTLTSGPFGHYNANLKRALERMDVARSNPSEYEGARAESSVRVLVSRI